MPTKLGTLISSLAVKAGIDANSPALIDLLSKAELSNTEIADEIGNALDTSLISLEAAKHNPALKSHYFAQALNGIDAEAGRIMDEYGFEEDLKAEVLSEKGTPKRISALAAKIKALEEKKAGAANKDKPDLTAKINDMQREKADLAKAMDAKIAEIQATHQSEMTGFAVKNILAAKKYAAEHLPTDVNITTADVVLNRELATQGAKIVRENGALKLVSAQDSQMDFYDKSNNRLTVEQFIDGVLAQNKLLAANGAAAIPVGGQPNPQQHALPHSQVLPSSGNYDAMFDQALADMKTGSMPMSVPA